MHERSASSALGTLFNVALGFAAGALVMYFLDPNTGRRRRSLVRDRSVSMGHGADRYVRGKSKQAADRLKGIAARTRANLSSAPIDDDLLHDRIRARLGRLVDHPHDVEVHVREGRVQLKGTVAEEQFQDLLHAVSAMRGVQNLESLLRTKPTQGGSPSLHPGTH
ncbi:MULTISPECIES: BON domain-containing protein [unclassified Lysobacter]|uniref:BON domain-containing protein n=1 Tax=unclassified Lysobacter TaxID=2635362 RepID=UPI001C21C714|nr:BON domain-containing protein [Lysobacter sp. MMG2]MBU8978044.1 BON domain-containing protein [Lysobacter sp. MMG2]